MSHYKYFNKYMIEKFLSKKHAALLGDLPFKYESSVVYLDFAGYVIERNGEKNVAVQDVLYPNDFPYLFLPKKKENWVNSYIQWATKKQLKDLKNEVEIIKSFPSGREFFYNTKDFIDLEGGEWKKFRQDIHYFGNNYQYELKSDYPLEEVLSFTKNIWLKEQAEKTVSFDESYNFFKFCLENQDKYTIKTIYIEVNKKLAGLAMGVNFNKSKKNWLALHIKVNYQYRGLSRFLYHERAKLFSDFVEFTSGATCAGDEGIEQFKQSLNPSRLEESYYVITGKKLIDHNKGENEKRNLSAF